MQLCKQISERPSREFNSSTSRKLVFISREFIFSNRDLFLLAKNLFSIVENLFSPVENLFSPVENIFLTSWVFIFTARTSIQRSKFESRLGRNKLHVALVGSWVLWRRNGIKKSSTTLFWEKFVLELVHW